VAPRVPAVDPTRPKSRFEQFAEKLARQRFMTWFLVHIGMRIDPFLMKASNGRVNSLGGVDAMVVLRNTGAKTGTVRDTPLAYFTDGDDVILMASKGGAPEHPAWLHNVKANPDVELWVGKKGGPHRARVANPEERARLWPLAVAMYSGYAHYQELAGDREINLVICTPAT
jgi:deazaflavin-dependent oxidoreductase (nitroreductase family)